MTDQVAIQLITSVTTIATIVVAALVNKHFTNKVADKVTAQTDAQTVTIKSGQAAIASGVEQVHGIVNSRLTDALATIDSLKAEVEQLRNAKLG